MYQTATHQGERLEFEEETGLSEDERREGTSRDPGDNQQSEYDNGSSDSDSVDFVEGEDAAVRHT